MHLSHLTNQDLHPTSLLDAQRVIAELVKDNERLRNLAFIDGLTELMNRTPIIDFLDRELDGAVGCELRAPHNGAESLAVIALDLVGFKRVNDTISHTEGDRALQHTAQVLKKSIRKKDRAARWGGDEFLVVLENVDDAGVALVVGRILKGIRAFGNGLDARIGGVIWTRSMGAAQPNELIEAADAQERWMKRQGLSGACVVEFKKE